MIDRCQHSIETEEDVAVREANHSVPLSLQGSRPGSVVFDLIRLSMRVSIDFDAQSAVGAVEVGDEAAQKTCCRRMWNPSWWSRSRRQSSFSGGVSGWRNSRDLRMADGRIR
jgi:hypothetical protein